MWQVLMWLTKMSMALKPKMRPKAFTNIKSKQKIRNEQKYICKNAKLCIGALAAVLLLLFFDDIAHCPQSQKPDKPSPSPTFQTLATRQISMECCNRGDTIQYHISLQSRDLDQASTEFIDYEHM
jgi:hypothetical protein